MTGFLRFKTTKLFCTALTKYLHELDELFALVGDKQFLAPGENRFAQAKLKVLKERMKTDPDYGSPQGNNAFSRGIEH